MIWYYREKINFGMGDGFGIEECSGFNVIRNNGKVGVVEFFYFVDNNVVRIIFLDLGFYGMVEVG